jgi:hypothetical protein
MCWDMTLCCQLKVELATECTWLWIFAKLASAITGPQLHLTSYVDVG